MSKHTPGPWRYGRSVVAFKNWLVWGKAPNYIASVNSVHETSEANARLIAAAPDLLDALRDAFRKLESYGPGDTDWILDKCLKALVKAEGEK